MEKRFENFTISILKLNKLVQKIKLHEMHGFGLKSIHVMCIYYLDSSAEGLSISELARLTLEDKAAISRAIATLRDKGYVNYENGYNAPISLTAEGQKLAKYIDEKANKAVAAAGDEFSEEQRKNLYKCLDTVIENLKKYYDEISSAGN